MCLRIILTIFFKGKFVNDETTSSEINMYTSFSDLRGSLLTLESDNINEESTLYIEEIFYRFKVFR